MRAAIWEGPLDMVVKDVPDPEIGPDEVLVKVKDVGICGSDLFHVTNKNERVRPPMILGHEISGTVHEIGSNVDTANLSVGTRVGLNPLVTCGTCRPCRTGYMNLCEDIKLLGHQVPGGFAEYLKVQPERIIPMPETVAFDDAYLLEPLAVVVHAYSHINVQPGDQIVVLGGGPIGLLCAQMARIQGATRVVVTDVTDFRLGIIEELGFIAVDGRADDVNDRIKAQFGGEGADIVVEAVGIHQTALQMAYLARPNGQVLVVGMHKGHPPVDLRYLSFGEQYMRSVRLYKDDDFVRSARLLGAGMVDTSVFGRIRLPLEEINKGFEIMRSADQTVKVVINLS